jgi:hypothetical protein
METTLPHESTPDYADKPTLLTVEQERIVDIIRRSA